MGDRDTLSTGMGHSEPDLGDFVRDLSSWKIEANRTHR